MLSTILHVLWEFVIFFLSWSHNFHCFLSHEQLKNQRKEINVFVDSSYSFFHIHMYYCDSFVYVLDICFLLYLKFCFSFVPKYLFKQTKQTIVTHTYTRTIWLWDHIYVENMHMNVLFSFFFLFFFDFCCCWLLWG